MDILKEINSLKFDDRGLIPAVVQDCKSGRVLTLAYMNRESLEISIREKKTCFWSRSRNELWRKGETSGNFQHITDITADCDLDALVVRVDKDGPACHLGNDSCFEHTLYNNTEYNTSEYNVTDSKPDSASQNDFSLDGLYALLEDRNTQRPEGSYTTYLFEKGEEKILKKIGEECTEVVIAAMKKDKAETVYELSDLAYHALVLMVSQGITLDDVRTELASRHIVDKKVKQETMK